MYESVQLLQDIVKAVNPKRILEMGTESGCSYYHIAQVHKGELVGVDCWCPLEGYPYHAEHLGTFKKMHKALDNPKFTYRKGFFEDVLPTLKGKYDIILYDGGHVKGQTQKDYELLLPLLAENGLVLVHDIMTPKCDETHWWWKNSIKHPSYGNGGRFGAGILAPKGEDNIRMLLGKGIIPHIRYDGKIKSTVE